MTPGEMLVLIEAHNELNDPNPKNTKNDKFDVTQENYKDVKAWMDSFV